MYAIHTSSTIGCNDSSCSLKIRVQLLHNHTHIMKEKTLIGSFS